LTPERVSTFETLLKDHLYGISLTLTITDLARLRCISSDFARVFRNLGGPALQG
jgi:hypothetical protein